MLPCGRATLLSDNLFEGDVDRHSHRSRVSLHGFLDLLECFAVREEDWNAVCLFGKSLLSLSL